MDRRSGQEARVHRSLEDLDLAYLNGVGYRNYDWFQTQIVRLAFHFVEGQELLPLVNKLKAAFPANRPMFTSEIIDQLAQSGPGFALRLATSQNRLRFRFVLPSRV